MLRTSLAGVLLARQKRWLWLMALSLTATLAASGAAAKVTVELVNHGIVKQDVALRHYLLPAIVLDVLALVFGVLSSAVIGRIGYVVEFDLRTWVYLRIQNAPMSALDAVSTGQMLTRVQQDLAAVDEMIRVAPALIVVLPLLVGLAGFVIVLSPVMGLLAVSATPLNLLILRRMRGRLRGLSWMELNESAEVTSAIMEPVLGIRVVHAFHRAEEHRSRLAEVALRAYRVSMTKARMVARFDLVLKSIPILINGLALFVGARLVAGDSLSVGTFGFAMTLVTGMTGLAASIDQIAVLWQLLRGSQDRFAELLRLPQSQPGTGTTPLPAPVLGMRLTGIGVSFGGSVVLEGVELSLRPGELVVVTGGPGSGKSTLAGVLAGHVVPDVGTVIIEGHPRDTLDPTSSREVVRVVSESSTLFAGTVRDNILLGVGRGVDDDELHAALNASGALDVVDHLAGGLDAAVGDRGLTLSGGQRQRIALARALVTRPRVLVLDDALSAVQPALELRLIGELRAFDPTMSLLFITRRDNASSVADTALSLPDRGPRDVPAQRLDPAAAELLEVGASVAANRSGRSPDPAVRALVERIEISQELPGDLGDQRDKVPSVRGLIHPYRSAFLLGLAFLAVSTLTQTVPALLLGRIVDQATSDQLSGVTGTALATAGLGVLAGIAAFGYTVNTGLLTQGVTYLLRLQVFQRISALGVDYYDRELPGTVATRAVTDLGQVNSFLLRSLFVLIVQLATVMTSLALIAVVAPPVVLTVSLFGGVLVVLTVIGTRLGERAFRRARAALGTVMTQFEEDLSGTADLRNLGANPTRAAQLIASSRELMRRRRRAILMAALYSRSLTLAGAVAGTIVLVQAGGLVRAGSLSVGLALTVQTLAKTATLPFTVLAQEYSNALNTAVSWRRLKEFFEPPLLPAQRVTAVGCPPLRGEIVFDEVVFRYPHTQQVVLHSLSATLPAGEVVALVGATGAGKSSITKLLQRAYDPDLGSVRVDGIDLRDLTLASYRQRVGVVPQDAFLFRGTVASNIGYGRPSASREEVEQAAAKVGAGVLLSALPGGFDAYVAEAGVNLTGAQRQLISLARACLTSPDVLVLDEATSALDAETERRVLAAIRSLGVTTIAVTHRESVVAIADHVLVVDAGRVVEAGRPDDVVGAGGPYDRLWRPAAPVPADPQAVSR